jgi:hypothetical protein
MTDDNPPPINTMYSQEFACMLIGERIPFRITYELEFQGSFYLTYQYMGPALALMMKLRASKL